MNNAAQFNMYKIQEQIKNNNNDIQSYLKDVIDWSSTKNTQEKKGVPAATTKSNQLPPIRNKIDISQSIKTAQHEA